MSVVPLPSGTLLKAGKYTIRRHIASGGLGLVYEGADKLGARWAIKECYDQNRVQRAADGHSIQALGNEPRGWQEHRHQCTRAKEEFELFSKPSMQHPCLVRLIDHFEENNSAYLVMPFVQGEPLDAARQDLRCAEPAWVLGLMNSIGDALKVLHGNGLIHRDLKPDNILLCADGRGRRLPMVLDTGATRGYANPRSLHTGIVTDYGPPEIISSGEARIYGNPCPASDCFALAGMACMLLGGYKPPNFSVRVAHMGSQGGLDPLARPSSIHPLVWRVLDRSLNLSVKQRHQSVDALLQDLAKAIGASANGSSAVNASRQGHGIEPAASNVPLSSAEHMTAQVGPASKVAGWLLPWMTGLSTVATSAAALWLAGGFEGLLLGALIALCLHLMIALVLLHRGIRPALAMAPLRNALLLLKGRI